jgi:hypothetical protein
MERDPRDSRAEGPTPVGIALVGRVGAYLVRRRPPGTAMAGYWEFPGGTLRREVEHRYPHGWVRLSYYDCVTRVPDAEPDPSTGFRWVKGSALEGLLFPEANEPIVSELARACAAAD